MLTLPPPHIYSFSPYINYLTPHLALTYLLYKFPTLYASATSVFHPKNIDSAVWFLDALLRTHAITGSLALLTIPAIAGSSTHSVLC